MISRFQIDIKLFLNYYSRTHRSSATGDSISDIFLFNNPLAMIILIAKKVEKKNNLHRKKVRILGKKRK